MEQTFRITTPPPSTNALYRNVPGRGRVKTKAYRSWRDAAAWELAAQRPKLVTGPFEVVIALRRPRATADADNRAKAPLDAMKGLVIADDRRAERVTVEWRDIDGCEITVRSLPASPSP